MSMSRMTVSEVLLASPVAMSSSRRIGPAPCQAWARAASARWMAWRGDFPLPVAVQPVGIAHHAHDTIFAVALGQVLGDLRGQVARRNADVVLAALDALLGGGAIGADVGGGDLRAAARAVLLAAPGGGIPAS